MKKFIVIAALASSAASYAASDIYDVMYLPAARTVYGLSTLGAVSGEFIDESSEGDTSGYQFSQTVGYSLRDNLSLSLDLNYLKGEDEEDDGVKRGSKGLSDPSLNARYRFKDGDYRLDFLGGVRLSVADAKIDVSSGNNAEATNASGRNGLSVGTQFGKKSDEFQWAVLGLVTRNFEGEVELSGTQDLSSSNDLLLRTELLKPVSEKSFLRPFLSAEFKGKIEGDNEFMAASTLYKVGGEYQYLRSQNVLLKAGIDYSTVNQSSFKDYAFWTMNIGANYQF